MRSRSGSDTSNKSNKSLSADNISINVSIAGGKTIPLNVRPCHTVANVLEFLSASTTLPVDVRLLYAAKQLEPSQTVGELEIKDSATLHVLTPLRSGTTPAESQARDMTVTLPSGSETTSKPVPKPASGASTPSTVSRTSTPSSARRSNKPRCTKEGCRAPAQPIVGDCGFCQKRFCGKHRMLESHNCTGLEDARQADKDRNAAKLQGERTVMLRGL